jgi:hypothetical protein
MFLIFHTSTYAFYRADDVLPPREIAHLPDHLVASTKWKDAASDQVHGLAVFSVAEVAMRSWTITSGR